MIPLGTTNAIPLGSSDVKDPTRAFPIVTAGLVIANVLVFLYELSLSQAGLESFLNAYRPKFICLPCLSAVTSRDQEDVRGEPFVGPAGRILDRALEDAGIDRATVFVTNVVKHFKWRPAPSGKRRLHERPNRAEIGACLPWVESELALVRPEALVLLGATATKALAGSKVRVTRDHGSALASELAPLVVATIHPSAVLRARGGEARDAAYAGLVADLVRVMQLLGV